MYLIDHEAAFSPRLPAAFYLEDGRSKLDGELAGRLRTLDPNAVRAELAGLLSKEQIDAVLQRRDLLLTDTPQ